MLDFDHRKYDKIVSPIGYPQFEGYPDVPMKKHLIEYFADELKAGEVSFDDVFLTPLRALPEIDKPLYITVQNKTGWSMYKEWWGWQQLIDKLKKERPDVGIYQIGGNKDPKLSNIDGSFLGRSFEENLSAQIWSKLHVGLDSVFNHTSNYSWHGIGKKSCVILFGSTQYDASGYKHNTNISLNLPCQPCFREDPTVSGRHRGACPNPPDQTWENPKHECMAGISVDRVYDEVMKLLESETFQFTMREL
jgi:hypothetical protein